MVYELWLTTSNKLSINDFVPANEDSRWVDGIELNPLNGDTSSCDSKASCSGKYRFSINPSVIITEALLNEWGRVIDTREGIRSVPTYFHFYL